MRERQAGKRTPSVGSISRTEAASFGETLAMGEGEGEGGVEGGHEVMGGFVRLRRV